MVNHINNAIKHISIPQSSELSDTTIITLTLPLVQKDPLFHRLATYRTLRHSVPTHLTCAVTAKEDHVLQAVHTYWAAGLKKGLKNYYLPKHESFLDEKVKICFQNFFGFLWSCSICHSF